ncbi:MULTISPECIES: DUF6166 domain-containing protein [Mycobacterium]|nr:DUF6166 domain-containing protein [Mycobacterium avium]QLK92893.1 hypothetical protein BEP52_24660 [Mycobacterium avium subsp. hominissuis]QWY63736.1 hypothetical protein BJP74_24490 [Mycobacterium avium subsp. hominissuis]QWY64995.1 hypothetical protein BJP78_25370 [Mycobacterium avium subsp. hominissuis]
MRHTPLVSPVDVVYRGYGNDNPAGGRLVMIEASAETSPLPHHAKHSPTGMSWGYQGSGAADLARSLLIHALGDDARCSICEGSGEVVYDVVADIDVPARAAGQRKGDGGPDARYSEVMGCFHCENGCSVLPTLYQPFKRDVVANLPASGWMLTRAEILHWVEQHPVVR